MQNENHNSWSADGTDPRKGTADVLLGTTGRKAGAAKHPPPGALRLPAKTQSRLCREAAFSRLRDLCAALLAADPSSCSLPAATNAAAAAVAAGVVTYGEAKRLLGGGGDGDGGGGGCTTAVGYLRARALLRAPPSPLHAWVGKPEGEQEFRLPAAGAAAPPVTSASSP